MVIKSYASNRLQIMFFELVAITVAATFLLLRSAISSDYSPAPAAGKRSEIGIMADPQAL